VSDLSNSWIVIGSYGNSIDAYLDKNALESTGIMCIITEQGLTDVCAFVGNPGIKEFYKVVFRIKILTEHKQF
jgi:hypothetical protein